MANNCIMKKYLVMLLMAVFCSGSVMAQKGRQGVGVNAAINICGFLGYGGGLKYQNNISDNIRIEPSFNYYVYSGESGSGANSSNYKNGCYTWLGQVNLHYFFSDPSRIRFYGLLGLGIGNFFSHDSEATERYYFDDGTYDEYVIYEENNKVNIGANVGLGLDVRLSYSISLQIEPKVFLSKKIAFAPSVGVTYNF